MLADLQALLEHLVGDERGWAEEVAAHLGDAGVLAAEGGVDDGGRGADVLQEVDEALGEDEDVARDDGGGEQVVGGVDEADVQGALEDGDDLGRARVQVGHHDAAHGQVQARQAQV